MEIIRIKSELPNTHFAPSYDIRMGAFQFDNQRVYERIHDFLLDKESFILELEPNNDAGTGVDNTDITNRFGQYNVCLLYTSPSPRDGLLSRMPSSA